LALTPTSPILAKHFAPISKALYVIGVALTVTIKKLIMRSLGAVLGLAFIAASVWFLINPVFDGFKEILSRISGILIGLLFLFYGATGYSSVYKYINRNKNS
jgi:nitrate reductase gamma subunit